jgi:hypothetical protein
VDLRRTFAARVTPASIFVSAILTGCGGASGGSSLPSLNASAQTPQTAQTSQTASILRTNTAISTVTIAQIASNNNGGGAGYSIVFHAAPNGSDTIFGGLTVSLSGNPSRTTSINNWKPLDALGQASNTNGNLAASSYAHVVAIGESNTETINESGGNWASGLLYDVAGSDSTTPIAADQWARGNGGSVTCPAVAAPRGGSLVVCEVYLDAGTANSGVFQSPTPGSGWTFDRATGSQYEEVFGFHANATTSAGQSVPAMTFNLKNGTGYLANWLAETVVIQPPNAVASATPIPWPSGAVETPGMADAFVDTVGVNTHLAFYGTLYGDNFSRVLSLLQGLGVRHVRDGVEAAQTNLCSEYRQLASSGIHINDVTRAGANAQSLTQQISCAGTAIEAVEGPNELDLSGDPNWASSDAATQRAVYAAAKSSAPSLAVFGPAVTTSGAYAALGDLSSVEDYGNTHDYMAGRNPGNGGWGGNDQFGTYGSMAWNIAVAKQASVSKKILSTETGYADAAGTTNAVPAATKGRYAMRTLLEHWLAGVPRSYFYELVSIGTDVFSSYGLTDGSGNPKPAYVAVQNLIRHLNDPGPSFTTTPLSYAVGAPSPVHHVLLQKRNGTYELILWVEAAEWDPVAQTPIAVTPQPVTLTFMKNPTSLNVLTFGDDGTMQAAALTATAGQATLNATNQVKIIDITP